jgi:uncharacterized protein involved in response to NO
MLAVENILFHLRAHFVVTTEYGTRLGIAAAVMLLSVIGGRIVPSFTHNWLEQASLGRLPVAFGRFDMIALLISAAALLLGRCAHHHWLDKVFEVLDDRAVGLGAAHGA